MQGPGADATVGRGLGSRLQCPGGPPYAYARYQGGVDTQLNALDADRDLLQAQLTLAQIRYAELVSVVQLYNALGGGWQ